MEQASGWFDPARLLVETYYPLGLLRAWTWVDLTARALVYPKPNFDIPLDPSAVQGVQGSLAVPQGSDDFSDIREYQPGDPVKHILWRFYAKSDELAVKRYDSYADDRYWLDFGMVSGGVEQRLSVLTGQALTASRANDDFGLRLPHLTIGPASGTAHLEQVLRELALYDHPV